jgi:predicted PurR-regulated permease PerM
VEGPPVDGREPVRSEGRIGTGAAVVARPAGAGIIVPDWLVNLAALGWRVIAIAGLVVVLWFLATILWTVTTSIAVAVVVSALFAPLVQRLRARGRSRTNAAALVWAAAIAGSAAVLLLLGLAFMPYVAQIVSRISEALTLLQARLAEVSVPPVVSTLVRDATATMLGITGDAAGSVVASAAGVVTVMVLAVFLVFFFLRDGDKAWLWVFQALSDKKRDRITTAGEDALARVGGYLRGTTVLSGIIALTDLVFMLALGVPLAVPLAVLVFLSGYIPYFGGIVTTAIILLVTYASLGTGPVIVMLVLIAIRNAILGYGIRPAVYGRTVSIHPALVLVALPAGFQLAGIVGLFAAVPVMAVILAVSGAVVAITDPDPPPQLPGLVPAWLDRVAQWSWRLLVGIALVALLVEIFVAVPLVLIPIVLATILAATLDPVVRALIRRGRSRGQASAIAVGGGFLAVTAVLVLAIVVLVEQGGTLVAGAASGAQSASTALGDQLGLVVDAVSMVGRVGIDTVLAVIDGVATLATIVVLSTLLSFYFLRDGARFWAGVISKARPDSAQDLDAAGSRAFEVLGGYMFGTAAISLVGATSQLVIMVLLGIPLAIPIFVLSFFLCFIPYIGGFISTGAALLVTIAFGSPAAVAVMVVWTLVFNIVTGNIVGPLVYGKTVHIHPAVVLVAIPAGSAIAGVLGMFIVVPLLGVVAVTWRTVLQVMGRHTGSGAVVAGGDSDPPADPEAAFQAPASPVDGVAPAPG